MLTRKHVRKAASLLHDYGEPHNCSPFTLEAHMTGGFKGTVTRNSNGSIEIAPFDNANPPRALAMGAEVEIAYTVIRTPDEIEAANAKAKNRPAPVPAETKAKK